MEIRGYAELEKIIFNSNQIPYSIEVIYKNEDGNKYKQKLSKQGSGYNLTNPEILDKE
ncbi:MAG: hypothetical protein H7098_04430 [Oligoflexus sp.]|nr:hypothetical protein [Pseudopedobacter sp.]